ncbi:hypothetical protein EON80_30525 [bacterium]|nr:MAG: hypothetical protein EON80_30525 [bacterium]
MPGQKQTLIDQLLELGPIGHFGLIVFFAALAFGIWIYFRRPAFQHRVAFFPVALFPILVGIYGTTSDYVSDVGFICFVDSATPFRQFAHAFRALPLACAETGILLALSFVLLWTRPPVGKV